jgi:hypothetical protein
MTSTPGTVGFSISPFREVHDIKVKSKNGRTFVIDIYKGSNNQYDSTVMVLDPLTSPPNSSVYRVTPHPRRRRKLQCSGSNGANLPCHCAGR